MGEPAGDFGAVWGVLLPELFHRLVKEKRTGILVVERGEEVSQVYFREGRMAGAVVFGHVKPLGVTLLEAGLIDIEALGTSLTIKSKATVPQGQILLELGAISAEQLQQGLRDQLIERAAHLLLLPDGEWFLEEEADNFPPWTLDLSVRPGMAVLEALSWPTAAPQLHRILEELGSTRLSLRVEAPEITEYFDLEPEQARVLAHLDGEHEIEAVAVAAACPLPKLLALVGALSVFRLVAPVGGQRRICDLVPVPESEQLSRVAPPPPLPRPEEDDPGMVILPPPPAAEIEAAPPPPPEPEPLPEPERLPEALREPEPMPAMELDPGAPPAAIELDLGGPPVAIEPEPEAMPALELDHGATPPPEPPAPAEAQATPEQGAKALFDAGMVFFQKENYAAALPLLRDAVREDPGQGLWTAYFAWTLYCVGPTETVAPQVTSLLKMASETEDGGERARYFLEQMGETDSDDSLDAWA